MRIVLLLLASTLVHAQDVPVLAELFTSEGCSSCPPADQLLATLDRAQPVAGARVIVLSEHVDYWDGLGWRDPFSSPLFTARQERYARLIGAQVYTPQMAIDGRELVLGNDAAAVQKAIARAARKPKPALSVTANRDGQEAVVTVSGDIGGDLWLAVADESARSSVTKGENAGRKLAHAAVVRTIVKAGKQRSARLPIAPDASRVVAFVTDGTIVKAVGMVLLP